MYATRALTPRELGILEATELKELINTRKSPTRRFNLVLIHSSLSLLNWSTLPARNEVRRDEEADPGDKNKHSGGYVVVANELETPSLQLHTEPTDGVVANVAPVEYFIRSLKRSNLHVLQENICPVHILDKVRQGEHHLWHAVLVTTKTKLALLQNSFLQVLCHTG